MTYLTMGVVLLALLAFLGVGVRVVEEAEAESLALESDIAATDAYRNALENRAEMVRRFRHDADGLLQAYEYASRAQTAAPDGSALGASDEVDALRKDLEERLPDGYSAAEAYPLSAAAIQLHQSQCAEAGIPMACDVDGRLDAVASAGGIDDVDLCILLQNLLDNAYEENLRIAGESDVLHGRSMALRMRRDAGGLRIEVENRTASSERPSFRTRKLQPELHGVGMRVVEEIVRTHGGEMSLSFDPAARTLLVAVSMGRGKGLVNEGTSQARSGCDT